MNWSTPEPDAPLPAPVIQLCREYGCAEAADLCGVTLPAIHGAIRANRLPAFTRRAGGAQTEYVVRGLDLWVYYLADKRRVKIIKGHAPAERSDRLPAVEGEYPQ